MNTKAPLDDETKSILLEEYKLCHAAYSSRDQMLQDQFTKLVRMFTGLVTALFLLCVLGKLNVLLHLALTISVGCAGLFSMFALLVDMQSTAGAKVALRKRGLEIESAIGDARCLVMWSRISGREKSREESLVKDRSERASRDPPNDPDVAERESKLFILASRVLMFLWLFIFGSLAGFGQGIGSL